MSAPDETKSDSACSLTISPFGFYNTGSICYFNSLLQAFLSCKYINRAFDLVPYGKKTPLRNTYKKMIELATTDAKPQKMSSDILHILAGLGSMASRVERFDFGQQSAHEAFVYMVDALKLEHYFESIVDKTVKCSGRCGQTSIKQEKVICFPLFSLKTGDEVKSDLHLHTVVATPSGYVCSNIIGKKDDGSDDVCGETKKIEITERLRTASPYIVLQFNGYKKKQLIHYPKELLFSRHEKSDLVFHLISTVEHSGSLSGGHYWAGIKRHDKTYIANDISITESSSALDPTPNTYLAFYELE